MSKFAEILRAYPPDCQPSAVEPLGNAGGLSGAQFWRLVAPRGALGLRCWPIEHPTPVQLEFIHAILRHAASRGLQFLPVPIATKLGATFARHDGQLWEIAPWLPGVANYEQSPRVEKLRSAMISLAKFHRAVSDFPVLQKRGVAPAVTQRLARLHELQNSGIAVLAGAINDNVWPEIAPLARQFAAELPRVVPLAIGRLAPLADEWFNLQPCIRDVWHDHVLFTGDMVTGLIDFGAVDVDTPTTDVARLLGSLAGDDQKIWREGITAYSSVRHLEESERRAIAALDRAGTILAGCNWMRWIYTETRQFENSQQIVARFSRILASHQRIEPA